MTRIAPLDPAAASAGVRQLHDGVQHEMFLAQVWRYPVKSMKGESIQQASLGVGGIEGDRIVQVRNAAGKVVTARTRPALLRHHGTLGPDGEPLVDGRPWTSADVLKDVRAAAGPDAFLTLEYGAGRFDVLPLLVATDGAISAFGEDGRRLRPNLVIGGVPGLAERAWQGRFLRIGSALIEVADLRLRCIMTTFHPDTLEQDTGVLRRIHREFAGSLALNCSVVAGGTVAVGDPVILLEGPPAGPRQ